MLGMQTKSYWLSRGWSKGESSYKAKQNNNKKKTHSPFSQAYWLEKVNPNTNALYTEFEAEYKRNSQRPIRKEYWLELGHSENESILLAKKQKESNNKSGAMAVSNKDKEDFKSSSPRCEEYHILRGCTQEEAINNISKIQTTFSLDTCIGKYGQEEGFIVWSERQDKWQDSLNSKSVEELADINKSKNIFKIQPFIEKYGQEKGTKKFKELLLKKGCYIPESLIDIESYIKEKTNELDVYLPLEKVKDKLRDYFWELVEQPTDLDLWLNSFLNFKAPVGEIIFKSSPNHNNKGHYQLYVDSKLLRSGNEIVFYQILNEYGLKHNIDYNIETMYNNSRMRCDFHLLKGDLYIEICGYANDDKYIQKMNYKKQTFNSNLLWNQKEYRPFLKNYIEKYYENEY